MVERRVLGRERHPQLELRAFDLAFANGALDLPLRGDADDLEKFAQSDVEAILVHCDPPKRVRPWSSMIADAGKGDNGRVAPESGSGNVHIYIYIAILRMRTLPGIRR